MKENRCHDCSAKEGEYHSAGCDMETCPFCGGQLLSCICCYKLLGIDVSEGTWAYEYGLTDEQEILWEKMLEQKGRIPYVQVPFLCALCGELYPELFNDNDWKKYVIPELQGKVLCCSCYSEIKKLFPNGWMNAKKNSHGK